MNYLLPFILFIPACLLTFTLPGIYFLKLSRYRFSQTETVFIGTVVGFVVFTLIAYIHIVAKALALMIPLYLLFNLLAIQKITSLSKEKVKFEKRKVLILFVLFALGITGQLLIIAPSGSEINRNVVFWSAHGFDGTWHLALIEEIKRGWPFQNPVFAGEKLINYHFFSDISPAIFSKLLPIDNFNLYFRLFPFLYSLLLGSSAYLLIKKITKSFSASCWAVFFTFFAGSFGFIVTYLKNKSIGGESLFWATQIQSSSGNPPQIISDFLVLTYLFLIYLLLKKKDKMLFLLAVLILGTLAMFKVYAAVVLFGATILIGIWKLLRRRSFYILLLTLLGAFLAAIVYLPNVATSTSFLIFQPWWFIRTMIAEPSRLDWVDLELRRQTYLFENNLKRVIFLELVGFLIFFFGNLGMRFLGLFEFIKKLYRAPKNYFSLLIILVISISLITPLLFLQKGVAGNTSQFLQYFLLLFGLLAGISVSQLIKALKFLPLKIAFVLLIIGLSIPTQLGLIYELYSRGPYTKISKAEIEALTFIKENLKGTILTAPIKPHIGPGVEIPNIWEWADTAYVAAISGKRTYFDAKEQVDIMGYDYKYRSDLKEFIFKNIRSDLELAKIKETNANIIYFPSGFRPKVDLTVIGLSKVFENQETEVWVVN